MVRDDTAPEPVTYGRRDDVQRFGAELAERQGLDPAAVQAALAAARYQPSVARFIVPPPAGTAKNWAAYRARFVEPLRIRAGLAFWRANGRWLANLPQLALQRLRRAGVKRISGGEWCTFEDRSRFYSYRRDGVTGRLAAAVWISG